MREKQSKNSSFSFKIIKSFLDEQAIDNEVDKIDYSKFLALNFNEGFGIKLEVCIKEPDIVNNFIESIPSPGATTYLMNPITDIKLENIDFPDNIETMQVANHPETANNIYTIENAIDKEIFQDTSDCCYQEVEIITSIGIETCSLNPNNETYIDVLINDGNVENNIHREVDLDNNKPDDSTKTSSAIRKLKKVRKPNMHNNKSDEIKTARSLFSIDSENNYEAIDEIFMNLPVTTKVAIDVKISEDVLEYITLDILKSIVDKGDIDLLQKYLSSRQRGDLQRVIQTNSWFFVLTAQYNHINMVASFLSLGANINSMDANCCTALMRACENQNLALINLLINNGASMNIRPDGSNQVLLQCCLKNKIQSIIRLLNLGINFNKIQLDSSFSLGNYAKEMNLKEISHVAEQHLLNLSTSINENILSQLGPNVKILNQIMPINVLSLFEIPDESINITFDADIPPVKLNHCNILFLLTGLIIGNGMKILLSDSNKITSVFLNDVEQSQLIPGQYKVTTSFSPLKGEQNILSINYEKNRCRKTRLILVAYNVMIIE